MARRVQCGFEINTLSPLFEYVTRVGAAAGVAGAQIRTGSRCLRSNGSTQNWATLDVAPAVDAVYVQFCMYVQTLPGGRMLFAGMNDVLTSMTGYAWGLKLDAAGTVTPYVWNTVEAPAPDGGATTVAINRWYVFEVFFDSSAGAGGTVRYEFRVNGAAFASGTITNAAAHLVGLNYLFLGGNMSPAAEGQTHVIRYDDVVINDATGPRNTSWPGGVKVGYMFPNGSATYQWEQTNGGLPGPDNWTKVRDPVDASSYLRSSTLGQQDWFDMDSPGLPPATTAIDCVALAAVRNRENPTASASLLAFTASIKASGAQVDAGPVGSESQSIRNWPGYSGRTVPYPIVLDRDPTGAPWTPTVLDGLQTGIRLSVDEARPEYVWIIGLWVTYTFLTVPAAQTFTSTVTAASVLRRSPRRALTSTVSPVGTVRRSVSRAVASIVAATGVAARRVGRAFTSTTTPGDTTSKAVDRRLASTVTPTVGHANRPRQRASAFFRFFR
jgi:hypothetical protein